jgi:deazaflavin-dependent oxidoreductase (nitroreductase family)
MTFTTTPNGSRGARQPKAGRAMAWVNGFAIRRVRKGGSFMGMRLLVLNTVGAKSGAPRATPVGWFAGDDGSWLIVASAGGAIGNPAWFYNIAAHPDSLSIDVAGVNVPVTAERLEGEDRDRAWASITAASSQFSKYEAKTDRVIPVIQLTRR